jgi:hypothetical protein
MTQEPVYGAIWPNAAEWPSDATLSYQYMTEARAAASATGPIKFFDTKAQADAAIGTLANGDIIEVSQDETRENARTRYKVQAGALAFVVNLDQVRIDLANTTDQAKGAALVGGVARVVTSIAALKALPKTGSTDAFVTGYYAKGDGGGGSYWYDSTDTTSADNGGTVIVAADGGRWKMRIDGCVSVRQFGAKGDGSTDDTAAFTNAAENSLHIYVPPSNSGQYYKTTAAITLRSGSRIFGSQQTQSIIGAWGVNCFVINGANGDHVAIEYLELRGYSGAGVIDAKTNNGIKCFGTDNNHVNYFSAKRLYLRGWLNCVDWEYTWNSSLIEVSTINCTIGLRVFGQSVNNAVANCLLVANGGTASIVTVKDVAIKGEGLMITNSLLAQGVFGLQSDGFLSLGISNCTVDLITDKAFDLTNAQVFMLSNSWVFAANYGINFNTLSSSVEQGSSITGCYITVSASAGKGVYVGGNNKGISISGGSITGGTNSRLVHVDGSGASVVGVRGVNTGVNPSILFNASDCIARGNTGSMAVQWAVGVPSQGGYAVATAAFSGATGVASVASGCYVTRNGVGDYTVTFDYPLSSAAYLPMVNLDRGGNGAMGYAVTSQLAGSFRFVVTNASATANDPPNVWVVVFN